MVIDRAEWRLVQGFPILTFRIDGKPVDVGHEQRILQYGMVYLGPDWNDLVPVLARKIGKTGQRFVACTDDTRVLRMVRDFLQAIQDDTFEPKKIEVPLAD